MLLLLFIYQFIVQIDNSIFENTFIYLDQEQRNKNNKAINSTTFTQWMTRVNIYHVSTSRK